MESPKIEEKYALPIGNYEVVSWDMIVTGGSLTDDMCLLTAFSPKSSNVFLEYVMPYHNMSVGSRRRHSLNVIVAGRYRVLKDLRNNKTLHAKKAFIVLNEFMDWLATIKGNSSDGIVLVNHDTRDLISSILIETVKNYNLMDRFQSLVKGFGNGYHMAESKVEKSVRSGSIRALSSALLSEEETAGDEEFQRVRSIHCIVKHLFESNDASGDTDNLPGQLAMNMRSFCCTIDGVNKMCDDLKSLQLREESLYPLFNTMRSTRSDRQRSYNLQRLLARSNIDYSILTDIYKRGGLESINEVLKCTMAEEHARELDELKHVFAMHFDPEYKGQWKPERVERPPRPFRRNSRGNRKSRNSKSSAPTSPEAEAPPKDSAPTITVTDDNNETKVVEASA